VKRNALLIGNTGGLDGVVVDVERTRKFLLSDKGGQWLNSEMTILVDPRKADVRDAIAEMRRERPDYTFFLFSGHGCHYGQTQMNLNERNEKLLESELHFIADRQLSIFDCCRVDEALRKATMESAQPTFDAIDRTREKYEARIMQAASQHARLYACSVDETSSDFPEGALYLSYLLAAADSIPDGARWKTVEDAHRQAKTKTVARATQEGDRQTPCAVLPKLTEDRQLILSIQ